MRIKSKINFLIDFSLRCEKRDDVLLSVLKNENVKFYLTSKEFNDFSESEISNQDDQFLSVLFSFSKPTSSITKFRNLLIVLDENEISEEDLYEKINYNSYDEISNFLKKIFIIERRSEFQSKTKESEDLYEKIKLTNSQLVLTELVQISNNIKEDVGFLLDLESMLLQDEQILNWNLHLSEFFKKNRVFKMIGIANEREFVVDDKLSDSSFLIFNLAFNNYFLYFNFKSGEILEQTYMIELFVTMILRTIQIKDQKIVKSDGDISLWKKIFSKLPYPMSVISNLGDVLIYNELFSKIGILPKECLRFKDQESIEFSHQFYKVRRIEFPLNLSNVSYFIFYSVENSETNNAYNDLKRGEHYGTVDELGIISSSIAHELNNPLAGILAALSLLSLEDDWSDDALSDLDDMKNGARRCKELIEIFLGFSKFSLSATQAPSIKDSLDQAINLLKFRMIESNLRLEMKYSQTLEIFSHQVNSSIMSMILYLILNELMTAFAHERLITQFQINTLSGEIFEFTNQIILKFEIEFEYEEKFSQAKLIHHLLMFEKIDISFVKNEIRLIYRS